MNDLNGLDWSTKPATGQQRQPQAPNNANYSVFSTLKPTPPVSGRTSPLVAAKPQSAPARSSTPGNDSFSNLVAFSSSNANKNLPLQEQQKRLAESKLQQLVGQKKALQEQWAGNDDAWNTLGSGRTTPAVQNSNGTPAPLSKPVEEEEDDLFAAFNQPAVNHSKSVPKLTQQKQQNTNDEDDDPFGLSELQHRRKQAPQPSHPAGSLLADEDDILGDLGKPVSEPVPPKREPTRRRPSPQPEPQPEPTSRLSHPQDKAVAELVDMGFPADKAKRALEATDNGMNVQAAVGLLLNQAHAEAQAKAQGQPSSQDTFDNQPASRRQRRRPSDDEQEQGQYVRRDRSSTPSNDPAKAAQEIGTAFLKTAGSFWSKAQRQVQQAVSEFSSDTESGTNTPKWMQAAAPQQRSELREQDPRRSRPTASKQPQQDATNEAMMLESERPTPPPRQAPRSRREQMFDSSNDNSRDHSPAMPSRLRESRSPQPAFTQQRQQDPLASMMRPKPQQPPPSRAMLSKQATEDQASQAYVSSARRRKPATPAPAPALEDDLLEGTHSLPSRMSTKSAPPQPRPQAAIPIQTRPPPPKRSIPSISSIALKASYSARIQGNEYFKRGDYSAAHESYSISLRHIPASHPLQLVLLTNRALTALKTGQPKVAVVDADAAITLIGPSKGEQETVDLQDGESTPKAMREYYGKSLMRKAEALENLEKWSEAATIWRICVEDGHGGATAIQGRARAERAAAPKSVAPKKVAPPRPIRSAPPTISAKPAAAVNALRAQNQAADKLDDEKFQLADIVATRVNGWRGGKESNLRALLASLDAVLWEGAGWKKIGMADLVLPNKVKIHYMKGIGKCHPDKISTDATTEQRMIAGAVFSTLNEAWDKFKSENNM